MRKLIASEFVAKEGIDPTLLTLADTKTYGTGVVGLTYRRKGKAVLA